MEKQILLTVHREFNEYFQEWFNILMEDDTLNVSLDDGFTPRIHLNGYDAEYKHLSGGEKTSIALAYRIALNQILNNLFTTIKTKDLIILDEPTDGFSYQQLDRIKDILDRINCAQIIIVSHDTKMESFVDQIIRVKKENAISSIIF